MSDELDGGTAPEDMVELEAAVDQAVECGWRWLTIECRACRPRGEVKLDVPAPAMRLGTFPGKLVCRDCQGRRAHVSLGAYVITEGVQPWADYRRIAFEGDRVVRLIGALVPPISNSLVNTIEAACRQTARACSCTSISDDTQSMADLPQRKLKLGRTGQRLVNEAGGRSSGTLPRAVLAGSAAMTISGDGRHGRLH